MVAIPYALDGLQDKIERVSGVIGLSYFENKLTYVKKQVWYIVEDMEDKCPPKANLNRYKKTDFI